MPSLIMVSPCCHIPHPKLHKSGRFSATKQHIVHGSCSYGAVGCEGVVGASQNDQNVVAVAAWKHPCNQSLSKFAWWQIWPPWASVFIISYNIIPCIMFYHVLSCFIHPKDWGHNFHRNAPWNASRSPTETGNAPVSRWDTVLATAAARSCRQPDLRRPPRSPRAAAHIGSWHLPPEVIWGDRKWNGNGMEMGWRKLGTWKKMKKEPAWCILEFGQPLCDFTMFTGGCLILRAYMGLICRFLTQHLGKVTSQQFHFHMPGSMLRLCVCFHEGSGILFYLPLWAHFGGGMWVLSTFKDRFKWALSQIFF